MFLKNLTLHNFRNYETKTFEFHPGFNIILGLNGRGKTNLLEALFYLSYLQSFRTTKRVDLLKKDSSEGFIKSVLEKDNVTHELMVILETQGRSVKLNGKKPDGKFFGLLPVLLFEPRDVYLFRETPSERRRFINRAVFLNEPKTIVLFREYEKVLQHKNKLLKDGNFGEMADLLPLWNEKLASLGAQIVIYRQKWVNEMNTLLEEEYKNVSGKNEKMKLGLLGLSDKSDLSDASDMSDKDAINRVSTVLLKAMAARKDEEIRRRESLVGPHRDDWGGLIHNKAIGTFASQGENRSAVIALKSAQIHLFQQKFGFPPVFLLDDIASELDPTRLSSLFSYLGQTKGQVFLTATHLDPLTQKFLENGKVFEI